MTIQYGCQTYTWQMSYEKYKDKFTDILNCIEKSGFQGVEAEICMLGSYYDDPEQLKEALSKRNLQLAALTLALPWLQTEESAEEQGEAERLFKYLAHFPNTKLILVQLPGNNRTNLVERQNNCIRCVNSLAKRASALGITCAFHPNSPEGSVFRTANDYEIMLSNLDYQYVGYCPDSGHIANGGMDVMKTFQDNVAQIKHVHFKDISDEHEWRTMGQGVIDHQGIIQLLRRINYQGWIMVEEESDRAIDEPDQVTAENGKYVMDVLQ